MCDIDRTTLYERIAFLGWDIEDAMTRPIRIIKGKRKEFMDKYYLIRDKKSGAYLLKGREWTKDVELATRYKSKKLAERSISNSYLMALMDCEVVELLSRVEILADLEAKLTESEERLELADCIINQYANKDKNYAQQLAEKEKELQQLKQLKSKELSDALLPAFKTIATKLKDIFNSIDTPTLIDIMQRSVQVQNQKAIEQLEKFKNEITPIFCVPNGIYSNLHNEVFKTIDNQIKQLKENK